MEAEPSFTRGDAIVPPEQVMTRLMSREDGRRDRYWLDYLILLAFAGGILAGVFLALRG